VGRTWKPGAATIGQSRLALAELLPWIRAALDAGEPCRIEIVDAFDD
jgi:hypothetical protein